MFASKMMKQILTNITTRQILANKTNQKLVKYDRANQKSKEKKALKIERTIAGKKKEQMRAKIEKTTRSDFDYLPGFNFALNFKIPRNYREFYFLNGSITGLNDSHFNIQLNLWIK